MKERLGILISGGGTTMEQIIMACQSGEIPMEVACVISSSPEAGGITKARALGLTDREISVVDVAQFRGHGREQFQHELDEALLRELGEHKVTVLSQNGWVYLTGKPVLREYPVNLNQHPGPPEFGGRGMIGMRVHAARLFFVDNTKRDYWTEVIAQRVDPDYDRGAVVQSAQVPIEPGDTPEILQRRALPVEHQVQIAALKALAAGTLTEVKREPLVRPGEEKILEDAKAYGRMLYPNG